ncbi:MAG: twin-arginine translocase subunit TatC [Bacillota bacterium]|nr:twin-arginine translocase subunit TatC [Bacillota bacterium]REJ35194.1 MAG: twin-arginine translocase subunit TatC [Bacillota bacterium]
MNGREQVDSSSEYVLPEMTTEEHLAELRQRILVSLAALAVGTAVGWYLVPDMLRRFAADTQRSFVFVAPAEAFTSYLKMALLIGAALASPVIVLEAWRFLLPALFPHEKRLLGRYLPASFGLFVLGVTFGYLAVYPVALRFFLGFGSETVQPVIAVGRFLSFFVSVTVPFGVVFQLPIVLAILVRLEMVTVTGLVRLRKMAYFLAFVVGAILTPPDAVSQVMMALPLIILFELTLWRMRKGERSGAR